MRLSVLWVEGQGAAGVDLHCPDVLLPGRTVVGQEDVDPATRDVRTGKFGVESDCPVEQIASLFEVPTAELPVLQLHPEQVEVVGGQVLGPLALGLGPVRLRHHTVAAQLIGHLLRQLALDRENVICWAVPALRPDMPAAAGLDQLGGDTNPLARMLDTALEHVANAELAAHLAQVGGLVLVLQGRVAGDDREVAEAGEIGDHVLGDAVGEPAGGGIPAQVGERQDRDGRLVDHLRRGWP